MTDQILVFVNVQFALKLLNMSSNHVLKQTTMTESAIITY